MPKIKMLSRLRLERQNPSSIDSWRKNDLRRTHSRRATRKDHNLVTLIFLLSLATFIRKGKTMTFGELIRTTRRQNGLSILQLSTKSNCDSGNISRIERGAGVSLEGAVRILKALGIPFSSLETVDLTFSKRKSLVVSKARYDYSQIRKMFASGMSMRRVAKELGCSSGTVSRVISLSKKEEINGSI